MKILNDILKRNNITCTKYIKCGKCYIVENKEKKFVIKKNKTSIYEYLLYRNFDKFPKLKISDSYEIDFNESEIIPLQEEINSSYVNNKFNLLASKNHVFNADGFRISYSINSSGLDIHVSKQMDKATVYADASINSIKPTFKWTYDEGDLKNCYFNVKMNTTTSLGVTKGKYGKYYTKFKDLDSS